MAPYILVAVLRVLLPCDIAFRVTGASLSVWRQDFNLILPFLLYIGTVLATWVYRFTMVDFKDCIELGSFLTYSLFSALTVHQFIPPVSYVLRRFGTQEKDRKDYLVYDSKGTPSVNWGVNSGGEGTKKFVIFVYSLLPACVVAWLALTVYVTTSEETLGWDCEITAMSL
jgi:hypothetical protein